ncbi:MAG: TonB-dependent receptor [Saprospiraceae bacterium]
MAFRIAVQNRGRKSNDFKIVFARKIIFFYFFFATTFSIKGQQIHSLELPEGLPYHEVFSTIEKTKNLHISFPTELGNKVLYKTIVVQENNKNNFIKKLFFQLQLEYLWQNNQDILIRPLPHFEEDQNTWVELYIKEKDTGLPIPHVLVHTKNLEAAEYTDEAGWCGLKIKKKDFDQQIFLYSFNYEIKTLKVKGNPVTLYIDLGLQQNKLPPITILGHPNYNLTSHNNSLYYSQPIISKKPTLSVFGNDPVKNVQLQSGIHAHDDKNSAIKIRGSAEESTLLVIDNMPIYKLDHLLGVFSVVNGDYFDNWKLFKNFIPIEFGGKTAGMFEINSSLIEDKSSWSANVNFLYTTLVSKVKISKNSGIQLGFRKSFSSNLSSSLTDFSSRNSVLNSLPESVKNRSIVVNQPDFSFYDAQFKSWYSWGNNTIKLKGFGSWDKMDNQYLISFRTPNFFISEKQKQIKEWRNLAASFEHSYETDRYVLESQIFSTKFEENSQLDYTISRLNSTIKRFDTLSNKNENLILDKGVKINWTSKNNNPFNLGIDYIHHDNLLFFEESKSPIFEVNRNNSIVSLFSQKVWGFYKDWSLHTAIRSSYVFSLKNVWLLPQLALQYSNNFFQWELGIAQYKQAIRMLEFENFFGQRSTFFVMANQSSIPISTSYNAYTSFKLKQKNTTFLTELYYRKSIGNLFLSRNIASLLDRNSPLSLSDYTLFVGDGRYYGVDVGFTWKVGEWNQSYQYSLSKSENRFEKIFQNQYFASIDDSRHQLKIVQGYSLGKWYTQAIVLYASGRPYTNVNQILEGKDKVNFKDIENGIYQDRLPDYIRWDMVLGVQLKALKNLTTKIEFSCFNIMNRANVKYRQFYFQLPNSATPNAVLGNDITQLGRTFNFSVLLSFQ